MNIIGAITTPIADPDQSQFGKFNVTGVESKHTVDDTRYIREHDLSFQFRPITGIARI